MRGHLLRIRGLVQGVGFRPYVWRLANDLGLKGWVRNDGEGVTVAVGGKNARQFITRLPRELPTLARIDAIDREAAEVRGQGFVILDSAPGAVQTAIGPDAAICPACIADICDPASRRWRYAFATCTHCGPRFTVSRGIPYDRARTSLNAFPLCPACAAEYADPADRRFHAETTACPACGPRLFLLDAAGQPVGGDPLAEALRRLREGQIVAIKGLGGFHLACDARNPDAVAALRERKQREEKPFAVMALNPASLADFAHINEAEAQLLASAAAPIVLCPKAERLTPALNSRPSSLPRTRESMGGLDSRVRGNDGLMAASAALAGVAPGLAWLGVMLPSTPLHLLLWHEAAGRPVGTEWLNAPHDLLLVMTSANPNGEPLVIGNDEALARLAGIADAFLLHDRDIVVRCDDSVLRAGADGPAFIRRARGYTPLPIALADDGPNVLALGGYLKNTVCVLKGRQAFLSQHIGGLENAAAVGFLEEIVAQALATLAVRPDLIAHDLHPDFPSTALALRLAEEFGIPAIGVGHHHAHIAAIAAEYGVNGPLFGLALDGVGLGPDGGLWGGELLQVEGVGCERLGHLKPLALPGGDRAARQPWRMAVSALHGAGLNYRVGGWLLQYYPHLEAGPILTMLDRKLRSPLTTSLGRWFDAAAGLLGVRETIHYEGQAAMELEGLAARHNQAHGPIAPLPHGYALLDDDRVLDFSPILLALLGCQDAAQGAALFHATVAAGLADWVMRAVKGKNGEKPAATIAIGGGCAINAVLMADLRARLTTAGHTVLEARQTPPNDGGLALGQAWVARRLADCPDFR